MKYFSFKLVLNLLGHKLKLDRPAVPSELAFMMLKTYQPAPRIINMDKWKKRNAIPGQWVGSVVWCLACLGIDPLKILDERENKE